MALIQCRTDDRIAAGTRSGLARIRLRARVAVIAGFAIGRIGIGTHTRGRIAHAGFVALVGRRADDRIGARARTRLTRIGLRASIVIAASRTIGDIRVGTRTCGGVARSGDVALIERRADDRIGAIARAIGARIRLRTSIAVIACRAFRGLRIGAHARRRIARSGDVALIGRRADDRIGARARTGLAGIRLRTRVAVVACRSIRHECIGRTNAARTRAALRDVALPGYAATNRSGGDERTRGRTAIAGRRIAVVAFFGGLQNAVTANVGHTRRGDDRHTVDLDVVDRNAARPSPRVDIRADIESVLRVFEPQLNGASRHTFRRKTHRNMLHATGCTGPYGHVLEVVRVARAHEVLREMVCGAGFQLLGECFGQHRTDRGTRRRIGDSYGHTIVRFDQLRRLFFQVVHQIEIDRDTAFAGDRGDHDLRRKETNPRRHRRLVMIRRIVARRERLRNNPMRHQVVAGICLFERLPRRTIGRADGRGREVFIDEHRRCSVDARVDANGQFRRPLVRRHRKQKVDDRAGNEIACQREAEGSRRRSHGERH